MGWRDNAIHDDVHDVEVLREIEMCSELIIVASNSNRPLTAEEIDAVLGLPGAEAG